jgi:hypothetical protein
MRRIHKIHLLARSLHGWEETLEPLQHVPALARIMQIRSLQIIQLPFKTTYQLKTRLKIAQLGYHFHQTLPNPKFPKLHHMTNQQHKNHGHIVAVNEPSRTCFSTVRSSSCSCSFRALSRLRVWCGLLVPRCPDMVLDSFESSFRALPCRELSSSANPETHAEIGVEIRDQGMVVSAQVARTCELRDESRWECIECERGLKWGRERRNAGSVYTFEATFSPS